MTTALFCITHLALIGTIISMDVCLIVAIASLGLVFFLGYQNVRSKKQIKKLAAQFLSNEKRNLSASVEALNKRFSSQEQDLAKAVKELESLGTNNLEHQSENIQGPLGEALARLHDRLEAFKLQEERQNWLVRGLANLASIKGNNLSPEEYAYQVINSIVKYIGANQGGFYGIKEDKNLNLLAAYAYGRRKHRADELIIEASCGLLGQSVLEKDIIYMTDVPKNYLKITSGLGEATPRCIIIIPLIYRDEVHGVIELASFNVIENHQREFLRQASEVIASELSNLKVQFKTKELLDRAQEQANQLGSQEEELRQSMEEMAATQEEMRRNEIALEDKLEEIEAERAKNVAILESCADGVISFNELGHIEFSNAAAQDMLGYVKEEMFNKTIVGLLGILIKYENGNPKLLSKTGNEITARTEVNSTDRFGNEISLLVTAAQVKVRGKSLFTLFAQKISVDLF